MCYVCSALWAVGRNYINFHYYSIPVDIPVDRACSDSSVQFPFNNNRNSDNTHKYGSTDSLWTHWWRRKQQPCRTSRTSLWQTGGWQSTLQIWDTWSPGKYNKRHAQFKLIMIIHSPGSLFICNICSLATLAVLLQHWTKTNKQTKTKHTHTTTTKNWKKNDC